MLLAHKEKLYFTCHFKGGYFRTIICYLKVQMHVLEGKEQQFTHTVYSSPSSCAHSRASILCDLSLMLH